MNISYKWLKDYLDTDLLPEETGDILTRIGLETGSIEEVEKIRGGLAGLVTGNVITCEKHPASDHLSKTTVDIGNGQVLSIVCGAPNVAAGQNVIVATIGTVLYDGDKEFRIKKSKIRGEVSEGMICSEKEIGLGPNHDGILVLPSGVRPGIPASEYFHVESDYVFEIDLTPNRIDAASHIGVARDLAAFLAVEQAASLKRPSVDAFTVDNRSLEIPVEVRMPEACIRYSGLTITGITVGESPEWLQNRLRTVGLKPINNIVDITNYVLYECGQPLHAFDADRITGHKVIVNALPEGSKMVTLDGVERVLAADDLIICDEQKGMCIAGVFGGLYSGITASTVNIFLESACFDPVYVRRTARRHGLNTDASFRFERGADPNGTIFALKRAALLIREIAGGKISSEITDIYPNPVEDFKVDITWASVRRLIGKDLGEDCVKRILTSLEIKIERESTTGLSLAVPPYRVDVKREADVVEEILRIYGYNRIEMPTKVNASLNYRAKPDPVKIRNMMADTLSAQGFAEIWSNSLTRISYYEHGQAFPPEKMVRLLNPLSADLGGLRQTLLFGGLEAVAHNINRQNSDLKLYEFGNCYFRKESELPVTPLKNYGEEEHVALFITGKKGKESWTVPQAESNFFQLKSYVENLLVRSGFDTGSLTQEEFENDLITEGIVYVTRYGKKLACAGIVRPGLLRRFDIEQAVYYADILMDEVFSKSGSGSGTVFAGVPKYPEVRRDLALLLDREIRFCRIKELAVKTEKKLLRSVDLFDVYEGKGIPEGKKSYAVTFVLRDDEKTLEDKHIDKIMQKLMQAFEKELGATLR